MSNMEKEQFDGLPIEAKANVLIEHLMMLIDQICQTKMTLDTVMQEHAQQEGGVQPALHSIYTQLNDYSEEGFYTSVKEMREVVMFSDAEWQTMINLRWIEANHKDPSKATYIQTLPQDIMDDDFDITGNEVMQHDEEE